MIERVGVYCRLSDEDRDKKNVNDDSDSIQNQKKYAFETCFAKWLGSYRYL